MNKSSWAKVRSAGLKGHVRCQSVSRIVIGGFPQCNTLYPSIQSKHLDTERVHWQSVLSNLVANKYFNGQNIFISAIGDIFYTYSKWHFATNMFMAFHAIPYVSRSRYLITTLLCGRKILFLSHVARSSIIVPIKNRIAERLNVTKDN